MASITSTPATIPHAHLLSTAPPSQSPTPRTSSSTQMLSQARQGCKQVRQDGGNKRELVGTGKSESRDNLVKTIT